MKSIVVLLLLVLFFVSGMLFGVEHDRDQAKLPTPQVETIDGNEGSEQQEEIIKVTSEPENGEYKQAPVYFTQKMASFFEGIVKGFYEIIVQLLYQIVQLFY
ncbi:hypothetical protein CFK37_13765 [Virgibacillus phasianinus]|uniref:Uncharacterized protein n=1 Tax=Virgibacillus phasianinus TaxID=2017483 RepID=A0A220U4X4_9BACI|nr:hypothetical protein [Virgibacillus phasianinus]ASK63140.1 hypothetical protein CFK37_13765 [Virgibacillus phasianinus]